MQGGRAVSYGGQSLGADGDDDDGDSDAAPEPGSLPSAGGTATPVPSADQDTREPR